MKLDVFFSISQTPVDGVLPSEAQMFRNYFDQVRAADELGFGVAWIAESHFSSEVQKRHKQPVIPHWQGEVGLNANFLQLATHTFQKTRRIECGSAVMNIVCCGGPVAHAERVATFLALHGLDEQEKRRIHVGFSAGRFDFMNRVTGILPRNELEEKVWPVLKGKVFAEACEIFLRLLRGDVIASSDIAPTVIEPGAFRGPPPITETVTIPNRWSFEPIEIVPRDWRRELLVPVIGSHDAPLQEAVNRWLPVQCFNLSITRPEVIEDTHRRLAAAYHPSGGPWQRDYMPRTVMVFINEEPGLTAEQKRAKAREEAQKALAAYWSALEGTLDPKKVADATDNAVIGDAEEIAAQIRARFHPEDRLMLWFDFFNHDSPRVIRNMEAFMQKVAPLL